MKRSASGVEAEELLRYLWKPDSVRPMKCNWIQSDVDVWGGLYCLTCMCMTSSLVSPEAPGYSRVSYVGYDAFSLEERGRKGSHIAELRAGRAEGGAEIFNGTSVAPVCKMGD